MSSPNLGRTKKHRGRNTKETVAYLMEELAPRLKQHLQDRNNLTRDDLEYLVEKAAAMKDERLQSCIATLIGWGDEERAELETFMSVALEVLKNTRPSVVEAACRVVEIRSLSKDSTVVVGGPA